MVQRRRVMKIPALALILALAACAPVPAPSGTGDTSAPASDVRLIAERTSGDGVRLTLRNDSSSAVGYNLCVSALEWWDGSAWTSAAPSDICTMELRSLQPHASAAFDKTLPADLAAGRYRFVTSVESPMGSGMRNLASEAFTVD